MAPGAPSGTPEVWGGIECTVNRVGDRWFDQVERSGHAARICDLDRFAALGLSTLRYPVLWERVAPGREDAPDWRWTDRRLARLRELGIRPVAGLLHHGSGPRYTGLLDPAFPAAFARFAGAVARRYPWIDHYTPVNEPLTTARFSALYGIWHPHARDDRSFARALLAQCRATVLAMRAIREASPGARLVQTDDLGKVHSTRPLAPQAAFENERRWLGWDLLCGRVVDGHPLRGYLLHAGAGEAELDFFAEHPSPPDVVGVNHYLTSERFLDHRPERYPAAARGGNGRQAYADVEAVRVLAGARAGPAGLLREAWERYRIPVAVTEVHLGCTREEQLRWLHEVWTAAVGARAAGVDVRAVTAWALLGAFDWHVLVARDEGRYEPGVFDLRGPEPRATALAAMVADLAAGRSHDHPVLAQPGWWHRPLRQAYPGRRAVQPAPTPVRASWADARPLLIAGAGGTLGRAFARLCARRGLAHRACPRSDLDVADPAAVERALSGVRPWAIVNCAGYVRVDDAEGEPERCRRENADGAAALAEACAARGVRLATFSSDLVFDGASDRPYLEGDSTTPLSAYGRSKAEAEARVLAALPGALVVRTSAFFGPWDEHNFVTLALRALAAGRRWPAADDATVSPTYVPDLVNATLDLLVDGERGIWHLANAGQTTWAGLARTAAERSGHDPAAVEGKPLAAFRLAAPRPRWSVLGSARGTLLPPLDDALERYGRERAAD